MKKKYIINESGLENTLLLAGFVPVIGEIADIILILKFLKEKRYIEAGLMMIALIPTFGDFVVKPFLKIGKSAGVFNNARKFGEFLRTNQNAAKAYAKVGEGFKNPLVDKMITQVGKVLPNSGKEMEAAKNIHINIWGNVVEKQGKGAGNFIKQTTRRKALEKYLIKTNGVPPKNFLSGWWNVVYKARRNRKNVITKLILGSNILNSLGIFNISDLENKMNDENESAKLLQDPKFKEFYDKVNSSDPSGNTESPSQETNTDNNSLLGGNGALGLTALKTLASIV